MRITKIRINGKVPTNAQLETLRALLAKHIQASGFITHVYIQSASSIKLGLHMRSFSVDTNIHGL